MEKLPLKISYITKIYFVDLEFEKAINMCLETLEEIASEGNGEYIDGSNTKEVVETVTAILNGMDKKEFESKQFTDFKDQFQWFLGGALFLLVLDVLLLERKTAWLRKLNLFNEK